MLPCPNCCILLIVLDIIIPKIGDTIHLTLLFWAILKTFSHPQCRIILGAPELTPCCHAYGRGLFPYAGQFEEALTRSLYAALRKWGFCLRQTRYDKALTRIVKGCFQNGSFTKSSVKILMIKVNMLTICYLNILSRIIKSPKLLYTIDRIRHHNPQNWWNQISNTAHLHYLFNHVTSIYWAMSSPIVIN